MSTTSDVPAGPALWSKPADEAARAVLDLLPDGVVIVDGDGRITFVNQRIEEMFGHPEGRLLGEPVEILMAPRLHHAHARTEPVSGALPAAG